MSLLSYITEAKKTKQPKRVKLTKTRSVTSSKPKPYRPKLGHTVRTIRGPSFAGQVIRKNKRTVDFKTAGGKMYRAHITNVKRSETVDVVGEEVVTELHKDTHISHAKKSLERSNNYSGLAALVRSHEHPQMKTAFSKLSRKRIKGAINSMKKVKEKEVSETFSLRNSVTKLLEVEEKKFDSFDVHYKKFTGYHTTKGFKDSHSAIRHAVEKAKMHRHPAAITKGKNQYGTVNKYGKVSLADEVTSAGTSLSEWNSKQWKAVNARTARTALWKAHGSVDAPRLPLHKPHPRYPGWAYNHATKRNEHPDYEHVENGIWKKKNTNEEFVTELKPTTLRSYIGKALVSSNDHEARAQKLRDRHNDAAGDSTTLSRAKWNSDRSRKRMKGISNASAQLASGKKRTAPAAKSAPSTSVSVVKKEPVSITKPAPSAAPTSAPAPKAVVKHPPGNGGMSDEDKAASIARINAHAKANREAATPKLSVSSSTKPKRAVGTLKASLQAAQAKSKGNQ